MKFLYIFLLVACSGCSTNITADDEASDDVMWNFLYEQFASDTWDDGYVYGYGNKKTGLMRSEIITARIDAGLSVYESTVMFLIYDESGEICKDIKTPRLVKTNISGEKVNVSMKCIDTGYIVVFGKSDVDRFVIINSFTENEFVTLFFNDHIGNLYFPTHEFNKRLRQEITHEKNRQARTKEDFVYDQ